jgi:hypothetical protein
MDASDTKVLVAALVAALVSVVVFSAAGAYYVRHSAPAPLETGITVSLPR